MFVGRKRELETLEKLYNSDKFEFVVMYGRRRVGKTTLISEFSKDKKTIFYPAIDSNEKQNLELFSSSVMNGITGKDTGVAFKSFDMAFEYIYEAAKEERVVLVIDEYPYLAACCPGISSMLASYVDHKFLNTKLYIILCGSSLSFMENQVLGYQSPLYGRRTAQMKIKPFTFAESLEYFKKFDIYDKAVIYGITGGIPLYMKQINEAQSVEENIKRCFFEPSSYLFEEPSNLIKQECREPMQYNSIIRAIASGASKLGEISQVSGINDTAAASNYISKLISLGIVEKEYPYKAEKTKRTIYKLSDGMFQFWYRFVPPNLSLIQFGAGERVYKKTEEQIPAYMGYVFEDICRQYLWQENLNDALPICFDNMGRWWGNDPLLKSETEVDIIADNDDNEALFAECKWKNEPVGESDLRDLEHQTKLFHYKYVVLIIFSKSGFTSECRKLAENTGNVMLIDYKDMKFHQ